VSWLRSMVVDTSAPHNVVPVDASWHMAAAKRDARAEFERARVPGARFFDLDVEFSDHESPYVHMLPSKAVFEAGMRKLGIRNDSHIVLYDASSQGLFSAARAWWMLRGFGHASVSLLDGGFRQWTAAACPVETGAPAVTWTESDYVATEFNATLVRSFEQIRDNERTPTDLVVDARSQERFESKVDEPRVGIRRGRIGGSLNVPFSATLNADGTLKSDAEIRAIFNNVGITDATGRPLVFSCGTGVTACVSAFAAHTAGLVEGVPAIYDGSWTEYVMRTPELDPPKTQ